MEKVIILMSTYNGEKYIREQIESIREQKGVEVQLLVRDDDSTDQTQAILEEYAQNGVLQWYTGENLRPAKSFMHLVAEVDATAAYYAFCDQDDIWKPDKLISAVEKLRDFSQVPAMYAGAAMLCDESGNDLRVIGCYNKCGFLNGETSSVLGCTMVFNNVLMSLLKKYNPNTFPMHDSWVHMLCLAVGGKVVFDTEPHIKYRQHGNNTVGAKPGLLNSVKRRLQFLHKRTPKGTSKMLLEICENYSEDMPAENISRCMFVCSYDKSLANKIKVLKDKTLFKGRIWWGMERRFLILTDKY